jgi:hypothetical protein
MFSQVDCGATIGNLKKSQTSNCRGVTIYGGDNCTGKFKNFTIRHYANQNLFFFLSNCVLFQVFFSLLFEHNVFQDMMVALRSMRVPP